MVPIILVILACLITPTRTIMSYVKSWNAFRASWYPFIEYQNWLYTIFQSMSEEMSCKEARCHKWVNPKTEMTPKSLPGIRCMALSTLQVSTCTVYTHIYILFNHFKCVSVFRKRTNDKGYQSDDTITQQSECAYSAATDDTMSAPALVSILGEWKDHLLTQRKELAEYHKK